MENSKEIQTRREFFKQAAKKALPLLGVVAFMSNPIISKAMGTEKTDCSNGCYASCSGTCTGGCSSTCVTECAINCGGSCKGGCQGGCSNSCYTRCYGSSY